MPATVLVDDTVVTLTANAEDDALWLDAAELAGSLGWELTPAGFCRGPECVPVPPGREAEFVRADGRVNLAALARHRGQPVVHDEDRAVWALGRSGEARRATRASLEAPDFALPDLDGRIHRLSEARGTKVLLASWASW